jgi:HAD superfamily hydrolase (TIGR01509 family)
LRKIKALLFDFDGLVIDTEYSIYHSWQQLYQEYDCQIPFEQWATTIGAAEHEFVFDPLSELERQLGKKFAQPELILDRRREIETKLIEELEMLPGVKDYLDDAKVMGLKIGLASSSVRQWIVDNLTRLQITDYFDCVRTADDVPHSKPDPALYLETMACLGVNADQGIAFEDSPNGVIAARRAGLYTVVVPNDLTRRLSLQSASLRLDSLKDLKLYELIKKVESNSR